MRNYYEILGVPQTAAPEEIKKSWRKLSAEYHPDKNGGNIFKEEWLKYINEAYAVLKDRVKRAAHDAELAAAAAAANARRQATSTAPPVFQFDANAFRPLVEAFVQSLIKLMIEKLKDVDNSPRKRARKKGARTARTHQ